MSGIAAIEDVIGCMAVVRAWHGLAVEQPARVVRDDGAYEIELVTAGGVRHTVRFTLDMVERAEDGIAVITIMERARLFAMIARCPVTRVLTIGADGMVSEIAH